MKEPVTSAKLRDEIDHGQAGDKVSFPDPAAAPLGTDDEAVGHPPTPAQIAMARTHEVREESTPRSELDSPTGKSGVKLLLGAAILLAALVAYYLGS